MVAPNLNGYKASFDFYFCPWSNYYGWMDNNTRTDASSIINERRHYYKFGATASPATSVQALRGYSVKAGSLFDYLGLPPGYFGEVQPDKSVLPGTFPAEKLLSVIDIYRNFYVNNQEGEAYFCNQSMTFNEAVAPVDSVSLEILDGIFKRLRATDTAQNVEDLDGLFTDILYYSRTWDLGGLPLRTYRMDLNRGIMSTEVGSTKSSVSITDNGFDIDTLRFANKLQKFIDRIDLSGGRFSDMMRARWGVKPRNQFNIPDYLGSVSSFFGITDVVSTASGMNTEVSDSRGNSVLGQQAGFAVNRLSRKNSPISFRADQYGTFVCMFSLVPIVTYSQGIEREDLKLTFADVYDPAFGQLGYQDVDPRELSVFPELVLPGTVTAPSAVTTSHFSVSTALVAGLSVGKRVAWSEYMSALPRVHGQFAYGQEFDYWVNNRVYTRPNPAVQAMAEDYPDDASVPFMSMLGSTDYTSYIMPDVVNNLFADIGATAQNFRLRVVFDMDVRRPIGSRIMPHL